MPIEDTSTKPSPAKYPWFTDLYLLGKDTSEAYHKIIGLELTRTANLRFNPTSCPVAEIAFENGHLDSVVKLGYILGYSGTTEDYDYMTALTDSSVSGLSQGNLDIPDTSFHLFLIEGFAISPQLYAAPHLEIEKGRLHTIQFKRVRRYTSIPLPGDRLSGLDSHFDMF
jgi:hypothetical protein